MKLTVWTPYSWPTPGTFERKCVFMGETEILPRVGEYIIVREGHSAEIVKSVLINLVTKTAEITIESEDEDNVYGPCLYRESLKEKT